MEQNPKAFVIMPFESEFTAVFEQVIRPALEGVGYTVTRADSSLDQANILRKIVKGISSADLIVADLTTNNPNVFYELGICHGLNIPTILLTQSIDDVPFDLRSYQLNTYSVRFDFINKLKATLADIGMKHLSGQVEFGNPVTDFGEMRKMTTQGNKDILVPEKYSEEVLLPDEEEGGILDYLVEGTAAAEKMQEFIGDLNQNTEAMTIRITDHASKLGKLNQNSGPGSLTQRYKIVRESAKDINVYSDAIEKDIDFFAKKTDEFVSNFTKVANWMKTRATPQDKETVESFKAVVKSLNDKTSSAFESTSSYRDTVNGLKGISRELNQASRRLSYLLQRMLDIFSETTAFCTRVLSIFDDKDDVS